MDAIKKYDLVFRDVGYRSCASSQGIHYVDELCKKYKFNSIMDVGCGPGFSVLSFLVHGKLCQGIEPCKYLFTQELRVFSALEVVKQASIVDIPCPVSTFDMVFCTDVLEHIQEKDVDKALSELVRISKKYIFCTICSIKSTMFPDLNLHLTIKPRQWWEDKFSRYPLKKLSTEGFKVTRDDISLVYMYQRLP